MTSTVSDIIRLRQDIRGWNVERFGADEDFIFDTKGAAEVYLNNLGFKQSGLCQTPDSEIWVKLSGPKFLHETLS